MLVLILPEKELFDEEKQEFITQESLTIELEHSLVSLSKWEAKFKKPFLETSDKTYEETLYYVYCMILTPDIGPEISLRLNNDHFLLVNAYIEEKMTATTFNEKYKIPRRSQSEILTAELIYYWMVTLNIPLEFQYWHLSRLFTLIKVFSIKNSKPQKMSKPEMLAKNRELNAQRKAELGTLG